MPTTHPVALASATLTLADPAATDLLGAKIAAHIRQLGRGLNIHLSGDLGAGKTSLARAILRGVGVTGRIKSPSFSLLEPYEVSMALDLDVRQNLSLYCYHFDFYRFTDRQDWLDAGFREYFDGTALCLVEWPEKAAGSEHWPLPDLLVGFELEASVRAVRLEAFTAGGAACLAAVTSCAAG